MKIYRSGLLRFDEAGQALYDSDGLLAVDFDAGGRERIVAVAGRRCGRDTWAGRTSS